jgi:hypothetical protein
VADRRLTVGEVDKDIAEALKFRPKLKSFYVLTTAPDDVKLQEHLRRISARHASKGLFDVNVLGWAEIVRRATLYSSVADKHFGSGSGTPRALLLATWFASAGRLELTGKDLALTCRELAHDLRDFPTGRILLRQRESDKIAEELASYDGRTLTVAEREDRLELRDQLARMENAEAKVLRGLNLMLGEPTIASWMFNVYRESDEAVRAVTGYVNHELDAQSAS